MHQIYSSYRAKLVIVLLAASSSFRSSCYTFRGPTEVDVQKYLSRS